MYITFVAHEESKLFSFVSHMVYTPIQVIRKLKFPISVLMLFLAYY